MRYTFFIIVLINLKFMPPRLTHNYLSTTFHTMNQQGIYGSFIGTVNAYGTLDHNIKWSLACFPAIKE